MFARDSDNVGVHYARDDDFGNLPYRQRSVFQKNGADIRGCNMRERLSELHRVCSCLYHRNQAIHVLSGTRQCFFNQMTLQGKVRYEF